MWVRKLKYKTSGKETELAVNDVSEWKLAIGSANNVVAYATIDTVTDILYGNPLPKENA